MMGMLIQVSDLVDSFAIFAVFNRGIRYWRDGAAGRIRRGIASVFAVLARYSGFNTAALSLASVPVFGIALSLV